MNVLGNTLPHVEGTLPTTTTPSPSPTEDPVLAVTEAMPPPEQKAELDKENVLMKQWEVVVETPNEDMFRQELPGGEK